jgi:rhodanese-related sulfurtransferase/catechol 2,3-dioxygenase-like lactoylglutathione lyase family enzyme
VPWTRSPQQAAEEDIVSIKPIFERVAELRASLQNLTIEDLERERTTRDDLLLVDIREIQETVDLGTIPGAVHVPRGMLEFWADPASPYYRDWFREDRRIVVFCAGGGRSAFAAQALIDMGYADVAHLEAGFNGWKKAGRPIEDVASTSRWMRKPKPGDDPRPPMWIGHVALEVADVAASASFFESLGLRRIFVGDEVAIFELRGGTHLVLERGVPAATGEAPFDLMVDDLEATHARLAAAGLSPRPIVPGSIHDAFEVTEPGGHRLTIHSSHVSDQPV